MNTVATVLLSSLVTLAAKWLLDRYDQKAKWKREAQLQEERSKREDRTRFHSERRVSYAKFLALAQELYLSAMAKARKRAEGDISVLPPDEASFITTEVMPELKEVYEVVYLLATPPVRTAARQLQDCLPAIASAVYAPDWLQQLGVVGERLVAARDAFHLAAREELGIEGFNEGPLSAAAAVRRNEGASKA